MMSQAVGNMRSARDVIGGEEDIRHEICSWAGWDGVGWDVVDERNLGWSRLKMTPTSN